MILFERLATFLAQLERRDFYKYVGGFLTALFLLVSLIFFRHYRRMRVLEEQIEETQEQRRDVQKMLATDKRIAQQRDEANALLAQDPGFKIGGYFEKLLTQMNLKNNKVVGDHSHVDHKDGYRENILKVRLVDMDMRQLCELLQAIDDNKRVFTKDLDITTSKKKHKKIDVNLTIATIEKNKR